MLTALHVGVERRHFERTQRCLEVGACYNRLVLDTRISCIERPQGGIRDKAVAIEEE